MNSPLSNGRGRLGELPAALGLLATADIGEESIAESWPVGKATFPTSRVDDDVSGPFQLIAAKDHRDRKEKEL
jgi:hypothetical protein